MRLTVLGATGGIGTLILSQALEQGHEVTAFARTPDKIKAAGPLLRIIGGDLFNAQQMTEAIRGSDAVLSAFGPTVLRRTHLRRDFGRTVVQALRGAGVARFLHVSTAFLFSDGGLPIYLMSNTIFRNVTADSRDCEQEMAQPDLAWTIVRPPRLLDSPATGKARIVSGHLPKGGMTATRADVAAFLLEEAANPQFIRQVVGLAN